MIANSRALSAPLASLLSLSVLVLLLLFCSGIFFLLAETLTPPRPINRNASLSTRSRSLLLAPRTSTRTRTLSSSPHTHTHTHHSCSGTSIPMDLEERSNDDRDNRDNNEDTNDNDAPIWDPVAQIYKSGRVPENANVRQMIDNNGGVLRLFGYGSLCWNPGTPGASALAHASVTRTAGRCLGYRRCWAQKSTDHRGWPHFPGIVCTLLTEAEFQSFFPQNHQEQKEDTCTETGESSFTEGLIYKVPPELVDECLAELDFREKGGYARDVIDVVQDDTGETVRALLYRGTPDNPAFWPRALRDLGLAAAVLATATGPSGANSVYLDQLHHFLQQHTSSSMQSFDATGRLAALATRLRHNHHLHFLFGCGSNQHNQLLLHSATNAAGLVNDGEDAHELKEFVLCTPKTTTIPSHQQQQQQHDGDDPSSTVTMDEPVVQLFAGGGHSAALTKSGRLYLWGWNDAGQLGYDNNFRPGPKPVSESSSSSSLVEIAALNDIRVATAALGFSHTLVIEKDTGRLWACGDNGRGQVTAKVPASKSKDSNASKIITSLVTPAGLEEERFVQAAAGLFHSAAVTETGDLVTFGCDRFGQCIAATAAQGDSGSLIGRWRPTDGSRTKQVACGRRHTVILDDKGRVWTLGDNKYGQLGRETSAEQGQVGPEPRLAFDGENGRYTGIHVSCGWSHTVLLAKDTAANGSTVVFGWGRNDRGQLGTGSAENIGSHRRLFHDGDNALETEIRLVSCGSEWTFFVDSSDMLWSCGWNEHGNLATDDPVDCLRLKIRRTPITTTPGYDVRKSRVTVAAGGAHFLAIKAAWT